MKITQPYPYSLRTIKSAVEKYVKFIAPTYGPAGKKTLIVKSEFQCEAVDDGKRTSESFELESEFENAVVQYIQEVTQKGKDGTTTAVLILGAIVAEAFKDLDDEMKINDYHGMALGLRKGLDEAIKKIKGKPVKTKEELYTVAYNSYKNPVIAELIADTVFKIGKDGVMAIEDSQTTNTTVELVNGLEVDKGYASSYLINTEKQEVVLQESKILLVNKKINSFLEILPVLTSVKNTAQGPQKIFDSVNITIIADGFGDDIVNKLSMLKLSGQIKPLLVEVPAGNKLEILSDIAVIVGAKVIDGKVLTLENAEKDCLGFADSIVSSKDKTKIIGGGGKKADITSYIEKLKSVEHNSEHEKEQSLKRVAKLSGGIAIIKVGAYTDNELKAMKTKVENAINSTQLAFKSGVVAGAGKVFLDIKTSSELLNEALKVPRKQLEENGVQYLDEKTVDPTEVVTIALTTAISLAEGLITFGGISTNKREDDKD